MTEPKYLCGLSKSVEMVISESVNGMFLGEPETMGREEHLNGFSFRFMEFVRMVSLFVRRWWVRLFLVIRLKSSA